ncbi:MAG: FtsX-like permease family protein [Waddliaceae bacterium]
MFELSVAFKYLIPRWRQLSVSIISLISVFVIALVVWLIVVFFSVTHGLEKTWVQKMLSVSAPIRITPTHAYTHSYYYNVDTISLSSDYTLKSIGEKFIAEQTDPYDPSFDEEIPEDWLTADTDEEGNPRDLVKELFDVIHEIPGVYASEYEVGAGNLHLRLLRHTQEGTQRQQIDQKALLTAFDTKNPSLTTSLLKPKTDDIDNLIAMSRISPRNVLEENSGKTYRLSQNDRQKRLESLNSKLHLNQFQTKESGWVMPHAFLNDATSLKVLAVLNGAGEVKRVIIPNNSKQGNVALKMENGSPTLLIDGKAQSLMPQVPLIVEGGIKVEANLNPDFSQETVINLQGNLLSGKVQYGAFDLIDGEIDPIALLNWIDDESLDPVLLPKIFRDKGVKIGDHGYIGYEGATPTGTQEMRLPIFIAGFYDPGIIHQGGIFLLAPKSLTHMVRQASHEDLMGNGIHLYYDDLKETDAIQSQIIAKLKARGLNPYWKVESYNQFPYAKEILEQLKSERTLFTLISCVIILVACSNIISMLIILVNDKKKEIAILRAMGASALSVATIFGLCGIVMGLLGSLLGIGLAVYTLRHLDLLIGLLSAIQGRSAFNPNFYGETLPNEISSEALIFVLLTTGILSLISGVIPALKASSAEPSTALRSDG